MEVGWEIIPTSEVIWDVLPPPPPLHDPTSWCLEEEIVHGGDKTSGVPGRRQCGRRRRDNGR